MNGRIGGNGLVERNMSDTLSTSPLLLTLKIQKQSPQQIQTYPKPVTSPNRFKLTSSKERQQQPTAGFQANGAVNKPSFHGVNQEYDDSY